MWLDRVVDILKPFGGLGILVLISSFLTKTLINHAVGKDFADYKAGIDSQLKGIEANYNKLLHRHNTRFSLLHAEQAAAIKELYPRLLLLEKEIHAAIFPPQTENNPENNPEKNVIMAMKSYEDCYEYFLKNEVLFTEKASSDIKGVLNVLGTIRVFGSSINRLCDCDSDLPYIDEKIKDLSDKLENCLSVRLPPLKESLKKEFRKLLGATEYDEENAIGV